MKKSDVEKRFYGIWNSMKQRCSNNKNPGFHRYGGRGITVSQDWLKYEGFKKDMFESYKEHLNFYGGKDTSLDRINNDGNYEKENCRWATMKVQNNNKSNNGSNKSSVTLRIPVDLIDRINDYANLNGISKTKVVEMALENFLDDKDNLNVSDKRD